MNVPTVTHPSADALADKSLAGALLSPEEARAVLDWPEEDLLSLIAGVHRVRRAHFGRRVKLNYLVNLQSGLCPEDCTYCTQSKDSKAPVEKYRMLAAEDVLTLADRAVASGAARLCLVASMRGPSDRDVSVVEDTVRRVKERYPRLEICTSLGLLQSGQAERLARSGVDMYNHNVNTSERYYQEICHTHTHQDRLDTIERAVDGGMSACSGALFGMGETPEDIIDVAFRLRSLGVASVPINFLIPVKGTVQADRPGLTPAHALRILCLFRLLCPATELRIAGGRELHLRSLQPLGLYVANSIFVGDYLTTRGQSAQADRDMIRDLGFEIQGDAFSPDTASAPTPPLAEEVEIVTRQTRQ
jgi:biotin synthase